MSSGLIGENSSIGLKEAYRDYNTLSEIAQARGDSAAAAEWAKKRDEMRAELRTRAEVAFREAQSG